MHDSQQGSCVALKRCVLVVGGSGVESTKAFLLVVFNHKILEPSFSRTDVLRIFIFGPPDFAAGFSSLTFAGEKCPEKSSRKIPGKILQHLYSKDPRHISREGPAKRYRLLLITLNMCTS